MLEAGFFIELIKVVGFPAVIFAIWYIDHKSQDRKHEDTKKTFETLIDNNFKLLSGLIESVHYQSALLAKISEKISSNQFCPLMRKSYHYQNEEESRQ